VLYGMIGKEVNGRICGGWFPIYINFKFCLFARYCHIKKIYGVVGFVCRIKFYVNVYFVDVCCNGIWIGLG